jgi:serine/threonine protein phosphatase 1
VTTTAFVGDIHGELALLEAVLADIEGRADRFVFLGDYVNRGRESRQVLDLLIQLQVSDATKYAFIAGNHDTALLDAVDHDRVDAFLRMGGAATLRSYPRVSGSTRLADRIPAAHVEFLRRLAPSVEGPDYFAAHDRSGVPVPAGKYGIFGHSPRADLVPTVTEDYALIDTGCGTLPDGRLTAFLWPSRTWVQVP